MSQASRKSMMHLWLVPCLVLCLPCVHVRAAAASCVGTTCSREEDGAHGEQGGGGSVTTVGQFME